MRKLKFFITGLAALLASVSYGQNQQNRWLVRIGAHAVNYGAKNPFKGDFYKLNNWSVVPALSDVRFAYSFMEYLAADFGFALGEISNKRLDPSDKRLYFRTGAGLRFYPITEDFWFDPYLRLGVDYHGYNYKKGTKMSGGESSTVFDKKDHSILLNGGLGINFWFGDAKQVGFNIEGGYDWNPVASVKVKKANAKEERKFVGDHVRGIMGVVFKFGGASDEKGRKAYEMLTTDTDGDGIPDALDACPNVPGVKEFSGCPDPYKDQLEKIEKDVDALKNAPTVVPVITEVRSSKEEIHQVNLDFKKIKFDFDKATIKAESREYIENGARTIKKSVDVFYVNGYADNTGNPKYNERLSQRRATAVKNALIELGVPESRLKVRGCGVSKKFGNRAENRRVEISLQGCDNK